MRVSGWWGVANGGSGLVPGGSGRCLILFYSHFNCACEVRFPHFPTNCAVGGHHLVLFGEGNIIYWKPVAWDSCLPFYLFLLIFLPRRNEMILHRRIRPTVPCSRSMCKLERNPYRSGGTFQELAHTASTHTPICSCWWHRLNGCHCHI